MSIRTPGLVAIGFLFISVIIAPDGVIAFEKGENRLSNGDFEADEVGLTPEKWSLKIIG